METNFIRRKPPRSPNSSPSHQSDKSSPSNDSCNKVLFINDATSTSTAKQSPTKTGIMSRLIKHTHRVKRNNVLLNALPINLTPSPTDHSDAKQAEVSSVLSSKRGVALSRSCSMKNESLLQGITSDRQGSYPSELNRGPNQSDHQTRATPNASPDRPNAANVQHSFSSSSSPSFYPRLSDSNPVLRRSNDTGSS